MTKYGWDAFRTDDFSKQYNADRLKEMPEQIEHLKEELFSASYKGIPSIPPEIKVGDKVRVCKTRWSAEGRYTAVDERYLKEGTVVSIRRTYSWYADRNQSLYEVYFDPYYANIDGRTVYCADVTMLVSYKEIYSHKPKGANFTYMLDKNCSSVSSETKEFKDKIRNLRETAEKLKGQIEAIKKFSDAMYSKTALLGKDFAVTTVDESPFINPNMDVASWYPKFMASMSDPIGVVDKVESNSDGIKFYVSMPRKCGKQYALETGKALHEMLEKYFKFDTKSTNDILEKHFCVPDEIKTVKTGDNTMNNIDIRVKKIMHNGPATIVFWKDGTKTVVRLKEGDKYDPYAAFTAAVAKRLYGKTMKISEIVDRYSKDLKKIDIPETPPCELTVEELKAAADKLGYRVSRKPRKK